MERPAILKAVSEQLRVSKVVALLGPRQSGKTTLARIFAETSEMPFDGGLNYFDLEDPAHLLRLNTPKLAMECLRLDRLDIV